MVAARFIIVFGLVTAPAAALAAPIEAVSGLSYLHRHVVNSGNLPTGLSIRTPGGGLSITGNAEAALDRPDATPMETSFIQVGNPFATPPLPYIAERVVSQEVVGGDPSARADYAVEVLALNDPDVMPLDGSIVSRTVENSGGAVFTSLFGAESGSASADYAITREYLFENQSGGRLVFNIVGEMAAEASAAFDGVSGFARSAVSFSNNLDLGAGVSVDFLPLAPYLVNPSETGPGATVLTGLSADAGGVFFSGLADASGDGDSAAAFSMTYRYLFMVEMAAGSSFSMFNSFGHANAVGYAVQPVPAPAAGLLLASALGVAAIARRRRAGAAAQP